jgi:hypothetical protein
MRTLRLIAILVLASFSMAFSQDARKTSQAASAKPATPAKAVHILAPGTDQTVEGASVAVRYEISAHRRASARPVNFRIQLDSQPPVETVDTSYTFDNVTPGPHAVSVELTDAKHRPIASSQVVSSFLVDAPEPSQVVVEPMLPPTLQKVAMFLPQAAAPLDSGDGSGEMPLLSAIGFGVLVGGMVSAMKTRV